MVELEKIAVEPVSPGEHAGLRQLIADPLKGDATRLYRLIERHRRYTNSKRAKHVLDNWNALLPKFVKIMPVDYRRALKDMAAKSEWQETRKGPGAGSDARG
jgi:glutamate synthase domain-containing protein 3